MRHEIRFTVFGDPVPKKYGKDKNGEEVLLKDTREYQERVRRNAEAAIRGVFWPQYGKYSVAIDIKYRTVRRQYTDAEGILATILDGMSQLIFWDNTLVTKQRVEYEYQKSAQSKVTIHVVHLEEENHEAKNS